MKLASRCGILLFAIAVVAAAAPPRERISINNGWRFQKGDAQGTVSDDLLYDVRPALKSGNDRQTPAEFSEAAAAVAAATHPVLKPYILPTGNRFLKDPSRGPVRPAGNPGADLPYVKSDFDDGAWREVNLPHDWAIEGPFDSGGVGGGMGRLPSPGIAWYRRKLDISASDAGKSIFPDVDGAMSYATVWLNGKLVGGWPYGYASWRLNLTPSVIPGGPNQLAIRLDNPPNSSRWYPGAGLYRNVWLTKTQPVHVGQWGTYLTTPKVSGDSATVHLEVAIDNDSQAVAQVDLATAIYALEAPGHITGRPLASIDRSAAIIPAHSSITVKGDAVLSHPQLWGPPPRQKPNLYVAVTTIFQHGKALDRYQTTFGVRSLRYQPDGLYVNGERTLLKGVNQHHDLGALGSAFNLRAAERQLEMLREMGCNAIRMAHNPPAPELLELTDRMGFLVMDEIFDSWYRQKTPLDFHLIFPDWHEPDLRAFLRRDRNHPSVFLWSVGNEVGEQFTKEEGAAVARQMIAIAHEEDRTRPATASMNFAKSDSPFAAAVDVVALNYQGEGIREDPAFADTMGIRTPPQYPLFHEKFPDKLIVSSESASAFSSRGTYLFPVLNGISGPVRDGSGGDSKIHQVSAYELYAADFGSSADKVFRSLDAHPYVAGEFVWTGWDYLGEPTPFYSSRSSYCGIIDLAGFPKDRFYLYQSRWRPDLPMAHILPHWTWPERIGQTTPVHVFTSGDEAELFLNGKSLGRKKKQDGEYRLRWDDVLYQPGELRAVAYKNGRHWATDAVKTADTPASLALTADRVEIANDGLDLSFITVRVLDGAGVVVPRADNRITFSIEGPGEIVATDNGNPTSLEPFHTPVRRAFNGMALAIVRARPGQSGSISIQANSGSLAGASLILRSHAGSR
ncbi:MAG TPA: beta-galactosidase GalB [Bryobacteraceae bacterium]|jgi:beta-galactosidase